MRTRFAPSTFAIVAPLLVALSAPLHAEPQPPPSDSLAPSPPPASASPSPPSEPTTEDYARARALYQKAAQAFEGGHYTEARTLLLDAWSLRRSYDVAASLGDAEIELGLFAEAAEHLSFSLRTFPPLENEQALANVRRQLELARREVAAVHIVVDERGAEVRVDQRVVGTSPLDDAVFVAPGRHTVEARKGSASVTQSVQGEAAKESTLSLELGPLERQPPSRSRDELGPRSMVPVIVGGAVAAAGLTAGIAFRLSANADDDHARGIRSRLGRGGCVGAAGASTDCSALRSDVDGSSRSQALSTTGFIMAGVALVATPVWWLLSPRSRRVSTVGLSAFVTPEFATVSASGRF